MAQLNLLGAQRVKALTEILKEQEAAAIAEIKKEQLSHGKAELIVSSELGIKEYVTEIVAMEKRIEELNEFITPKTGGYYKITHGYNYGNTRSQYNEMLAKAQAAGTDKKIAAVKAEFKRKEQSLWLCETLEEAKAIVGIE
ncbi:hypothetical protein [Cytobacillus solani]|uniref:Uncharacterized protein n=1 Tax=Cytobacillus solani TaxID=1637975 RepID=A0A0Q3QLE9_9BACI|nr:hypothetical protein [Cytobacillus solani]KQL18825.1 hypothetical protein AN957_09735 [Cytobacillus solani]